MLFRPNRKEVVQQRWTNHAFISPNGTKQDDLSDLSEAIHKHGILACGELFGKSTQFGNEG